MWERLDVILGRVMRIWIFVMFVSLHNGRNFLKSIEVE